METPTADPVLSKAFGNIVYSGRPSPVSPGQHSITRQAVAVHGKPFSYQTERADNPVKQAEMGIAMSLFATEPSDTKLKEPAVTADNQIHEKSNHLVRPTIRDKNPSIGFKHYNPGKSTLNLKPCQSPMATILIGGVVKSQNESAVVCGTSNSDSAPLSMEPSMSEIEAEHTQEPTLEANNTNVPPRSQSRELQDPDPVLGAQPNDIEPTTTGPSIEPSAQGLLRPSIIRTNAATDEPSRPSSVAVEATPTHLEQKGVSSNERSSNENMISHRNGDIDMSDEQTLVNEVSGSCGMSQNSSASSSTSPRTLPQEPANNRHLNSEPGIANCEERAEPHTVSEPHEALHSPLNGSSTCSEVTSSKDKNDQSMDPDHLLKALVKHHEDQKQQTAQFHAREQDREIHLRNLELLCQALSQQLQENEEKMAQQGNELAKYRQTIPGWQERLKKFGKIVNGLANDHDRLRDSGHAIQKEQRGLVIQTDSMRRVLDDTTAALKDHRIQHQKLVSKARSDIISHEQALNTKNLDLLNETARLQVEQRRSESLQQILDKSTSSYEGLSVRLTQHEAAMGSKLSNLCVKIESAVGKTSFAGQEDLVNKLQECLSLLKESRPAAPNSSDEIHNLDLAIRANTDRSADTTAQLEDKLVSQYHAHFQEALSSIEAGQVSQQQISDLREIKATIRERLSAAETTLVDSRQKIATFQNQDQLRLQKIAALEAEIYNARNQTHESPLLALRLHDAEKQSAALKEQVVKYKKQLDASEADIAVKSKDSSDLQTRLEVMKAELEEQRTRFERISEEKTAVEAQAVVTANTIRADLSKVCQNEISKKTNHLLNEVKGLQHQISVTEREVVTGKDRIEQLQAEKLAVVENTGHLEETITGLQRAASTSHDTISQLKQRLEEVHHQRIRKDEEFREAQDELRSLRAARSSEIENTADFSTQTAQQLSAAEAAKLGLETEIAGMRESFEQTKGLLAAADSRSRTQEAQIQELSNRLAAVRKSSATAASSPVLSSNRAQSAERQSVVVEDSQDRAPKPRKGILKSKAVVEDSQETAQTHQHPYRQLSPGELSRGESLPRMSKEVREMLQASSSPLTDIQRTSSPVMDGGAMFPPSPGDSQGKIAHGLSARKRGEVSSHGKTTHRESSTGCDLWSYETSTTSTRVRSMSASLHGISGSTSSHFTPRRNVESGKSTHPKSQTAGFVLADSQPNRQSQPSQEDHGMKRLHPGSKSGAASLESQSKRRRLSTDKEKVPGQTSPAKSTTLRRSTLRRSQKEDKFNERFQKELGERTT
ncbi:MAG: hypothetical protein Q9173_006381 [Seirophora scorigena]